MAASDAEGPDTAPPSGARRLLRSVAVYSAVAAASAAVAAIAALEVVLAKDIPEGGIVESLQTGLLALSAAAWFRLAAYGKRSEGAPRRAFVLVGLAALAMFFRELDAFFDESFSHGSWVVADSFVLAAAAAVFFADGRRTVSDLADFAESPHGMVAWFAFFGIVFFSRVLGWKVLWNAVFDIDMWRETAEKVRVYDQNAIRHVKNVAEESLELFCYTVLLAGAFLPRALSRRK